MPASSTDGIPRPQGVLPVQLRFLVEYPDVRGAFPVVRRDEVAVTGVSATAAQVQPGDLFAALPGSNVHGAEFTPDALAAGAVAVLTDPAGLALLGEDVPVIVTESPRDALGGISAKVYGNPAEYLRTLGVTGTSGKTTTTYLVRAGLVAAGRASGLIGTVATMIGDEVVKGAFTTPEAPELQALLAVMRERGVTDVAMEVSSHALRMGRVNGIGFDVGAFTNLSEDHLDFHANMYDYFDAKADLVTGRTDNPIVVRDDVWGERMVDVVGACITVGTHGRTGDSWEAHDIRERTDGTTTFRVLGPWWDGVGRTGEQIPRIELAMGCAIPGRYNVANALLALAILHEAGVPLAVAAPAIAAAQVPGRMERIDEGQPFLAVVDYSHKPAAVDGALRALRPLTGGRLIVVLGCGGDRDRGKRPHMGEIAARGADLLIVTDDNPRSEEPATIRRAMLDGALAVPSAARGEVVEVGDRAEAIERAVSLARAGDTVLVAGKGHETGQEVAGVIHPFDDRNVLRRALA